MPRPKKLFLCEHPNHGKRRDLEQIKEHLSALAPNLKVQIISGKMNVFQRVTNQGCSILSMTPWKYPTPKNSQVYAGKNLTKAQECQILDDHHVPVPRWYLWKEGEMLPNEIRDWGDYIVRKPNIGSRGAEVRMVNRSHLKWKKLHVKYRNVSSEPFLQEFIYTGECPVSYRVGTFLGEPLYSVKIEAPKSNSPRKEAETLGEAKCHRNSRIAANSKKSRYTYCRDAAVLDLARRAHRAFPGHPMLAVDIIRDHATGQLWVVEVNASGYCWHLSSEVGRGIQETHRLNFYTQFGGLERAAEVIANRFG